MFNSKKLYEISISIEDIEFVNDLLIKAGDIAIDRHKKGLKDINTKDAPDDLVTEVDKELNAFIIKEIKDRFVNDAIISEEAPPDGDINNAPKTWVIDPIDGTDNYVRNDGWYSVMIGILKDNSPVVGWVYSPVRKLIILGIPDDGVYKKAGTNPMEKLKVEEIGNKNNVRLMMGRRDRKYNPTVKEKLSSCEFVEMGSLGLKVIHIIENKADIFIHTLKQIKIWDTVAPSAIAIAANLHLSSLENEKFCFSLDEIKHNQTYAVGRKWAFDTVEKLLKNN